MSKILQSDVIAVIEEALEMKSGLLRENTHAEEINNWDSLGQLNILVALDKLFDGKIANITDMAEADSMPKILNLLRQHSLL
jgi:acyl carrier protein